jgi:uncharacterized damage-inducible protein DinB
MDVLDRMLGHDHWATTQILTYCHDLTDAQLDQEFDIGRRTLRETLKHQIRVVDFWPALMLGRAQADRPERPSIAELSERHERFHAAFAAFARQARDEGRLDDTFTDHYDIRQSVGATIIQLMWHNTQHRSEARHILERLGVSVRGDLDPQEWEHATGRV